MTLNEKIINFMEAIKNAYRTEENQVPLQKMQLNDGKYPFGVYACEKQPAGRAYKKVRGDFFCAYGTRTDKE